MSTVEAATVQDTFSEFLEQNLNKELLRFTTAGSVDDGKSTLIGRLLHDSKGVYEDQLASVKKSRINRSTGPIDFSLLTDGLRAEREQGITIDVGYRYFATARRKFIIADTPGHEQYTRNMATGASTAELAVILIDGTKGLLPQTIRHAYISSLLGIRYVLAAVNKMDLVGYGEREFLAVREAFLALAKQLGIPHVQCIPVSALAGDNVVSRSNAMPWYSGPTFLEHLENVPIIPPALDGPLRFAVQYVLRPDASFRGFAGQVASGVVRPGDEVIALPSGRRTQVRRIVSFDGDQKEAYSPMSVTLQLRDEIDLSRGDLLVAAENPPSISRQFRAMVVWMNAEPMKIGRSYLVKHGSRQVRGSARQIAHRVNVNTLATEPAPELQMNDIASVEFETKLQLLFDPYSQNRTMGSFILIDPLTNATLGAGMIQEDLASSPNNRNLVDVTNADISVSAAERSARRGHSPLLILLRGQTNFAAHLQRALFDLNLDVFGLSRGDAAFPSRLAVVQSLLATGLIVLHSVDDLSTAEIAALRKAAKDHVQEISAANLSSDPEQFRTKLASIAEEIFQITKFRRN